jgi:hypothetical protein
MQVLDRLSCHTKHNSLDAQIFETYGIHLRFLGAKQVN